MNQQIVIGGVEAFGASFMMAGLWLWGRSEVNLRPCHSAEPTSHARIKDVPQLNFLGRSTKARFISAIASVVLTMLLAGSVRAQYLSPGWPKAGGDMFNRGQGSPVGLAMNMVWEAGVADIPVTQCAVDSAGNSYLGTYTGFLYALDPSGNIRWTYPPENFSFAEDPMWGGAAIGTNGLIYTGSNEGALYALNASNGSLVWKYQTRSAIDTSPSVGLNGTVYTASSDGVLYALNGTTGRLAWTRAIANGPCQLTTPAIGNDYLIYVGTATGWIYAVSPKDGSVVWRYLADSAVVVPPTVGTDGTVYVATNGGYVYAIDADKGIPFWVSLAGVSPMGMCLHSSGVLYVNCSYGLYALSAARGTQAWSSFFVSKSGITVSADGTVFGALLHSAGNLEFSYLQGFNGGTGQPIYYYNGNLECLGPPALGLDGTLYVSSYEQSGNSVYTLSTGGTTPAVTLDLSSDTTGYGPNKVYGRVTLPSPAGRSGASVALTVTGGGSSVTAPSAVKVPAGESTAMFPVTVSETPPSGGKLVCLIEATLGGYSSFQRLEVLPAISLDFQNVNQVGPVVNSISGDVVNGIVTLKTPAPAGGQTVTLHSNQPNSGLPPTKIAIAAGQTRGFFQIPVKTGDSSVVETVTASASSLGTAEAAIQIYPTPVLNSLTVTPTPFQAGTSFVGTILFSPSVGPRPVQVTLASEGEGITIPSTITMPPGASSAKFSGSFAQSLSESSARITATYNSIGKYAIGSVAPSPFLLSLSSTTLKLRSGDIVGTIQVTPSTQARTVDLSVNVSQSRNLTIKLPSSVTIPARASTVTFDISASGRIQTAVTLTASEGNYSYPVTFTTT